MPTTTKDKTVTCGTCGVTFPDMKTHDEHVCSVTGFTPKDPEHYGTQSMRASKEALRRGGSLTKAREKAIDDRIAEAETKGVDHKINTRKAQVIAENKENRKR